MLLSQMFLFILDELLNYGLLFIGAIAVLVIGTAALSYSENSRELGAPDEEEINHWDDHDDFWFDDFDNDFDHDD